MAFENSICFAGFEALCEVTGKKGKEYGLERMLPVQRQGGAEFHSNKRLGRRIRSRPPGPGVKISPAGGGHTVTSDSTALARQRPPGRARTRISSAVLLAGQKRQTSSC